MAKTPECYHCFVEDRSFAEAHKVLRRVGGDKWLASHPELLLDYGLSLPLCDKHIDAYKTMHYYIIEDISLIETNLNLNEVLYGKHEAR